MNVELANDPNEPVKFTEIVDAVALSKAHHRGKRDAAGVDRPETDRDGAVASQGTKPCEICGRLRQEIRRVPVRRMLEAFLVVIRLQELDVAAPLALPVEEGNEFPTIA